MLLPPLSLLALWGRRRLAPRAGVRGAAAQRPAGRRAPRGRCATCCVAALVVFGLFALAGVAHGAPLEAPADPLGDYPARPEWFLMPLFQLRKFFHGALEFWGTSLVPAAVAAVTSCSCRGSTGPGARGRSSWSAPVLAVFGGAVALGARRAQPRRARRHS